jgi:Phospholipase_D-nuclease N-terminal
MGSLSDRQRLCSPRRLLLCAVLISNGDDTELETMDFGYGIGGIIVLILDIWALINILQSGASNGAKLLWILLIFLLPLIGFIIWLLAGPGGRRVRL